MNAKPQLADLPLERLTRLAREATQKAARDAVAAGHAVVGWKGGRIERFGPGGASVVLRAA
ncbi:hypothetical protein AZOA_17910 [Azoarcus sp. Aa7]|nr:hypothetical protein [Azoarcus sp. Aa7]